MTTADDVTTEENRHCAICFKPSEELNEQTRCMKCACRNMQNIFLVDGTLTPRWQVRVCIRGHKRIVKNFRDLDVACGFRDGSTMIRDAVRSLKLPKKVLPRVVLDSNEPRSESQLLVSESQPLSQSVEDAVTEETCTHMQLEELQQTQAYFSNFYCQVTDALKIPLDSAVDACGSTDAYVCRFPPCVQFGCGSLKGLLQHRHLVHFIAKAGQGMSQAEMNEWLPVEPHMLPVVMADNCFQRRILDFARDDTYWNSVMATALVVVEDHLESLRTPGSGSDSESDDAVTARATMGLLQTIPPQAVFSWRFKSSTGPSSQQS